MVTPCHSADKCTCSVVMTTRTVAASSQSATLECIDVTHDNDVDNSAVADNNI